MDPASSVRHEPAVYFVTVLGTIVALIVAFAHLSQTDAAYLSAFVTGLGTIVTALLARPRHVAVIGGAVADILQSLVLFKIHLSAQEQAAVIQAVALVTGYLALRPNLVPDHSA
jgi:hypothetical protein